MSEQPEALRLADIIGGHCADELRRLHSVNAELLGLLRALMDTRHKHFIDNGIDGMHGWDEQVEAAIARAEGVQP